MEPSPYQPYQPQGQPIESMPHPQMAPNQPQQFSSPIQPQPAWPQQPQSTAPAEPQPYLQPVPQGAQSIPGQPPRPGADWHQNSAENNRKNYVGAVLISHFVGVFGIDRFYLGYTGLGIGKLLTFGGLGIWSFIDMCLLVFGKTRQKDDPRPLEGYTQYGKVMKIIFGVLLGLQLLIIPTALIVIFILIPIYAKAGS